MKLLQRLRRHSPEPIVAEEISSIIRFVRERKHFATLLFLLHADVRMSRKVLCDCTDAVKEPFLLFLMKNQPTAELVTVVLTVLSRESEKCFLDENERNALHVAATHGCDAQVVDVLLHDGTGLIRPNARDMKQRCPLHDLCANPMGFPSTYVIHRAKFLSTNGKNVTDTASLLLQAYPYAVLARDGDGNTPMDLALKNGADEHLISMLNEAIERCNTNRPQSNSSIEWIPGIISESSLSDNDDLSSIGFNDEPL